MIASMKKYFLTGLATLLPLAVTLYVLSFAINFLTSPFMDIVIKLLSKLPITSFGLLTSNQLIRTISQVLILIALFLLVLFIGMFARWLLFDSLIKLGDRILNKIPLFNKVYRPTKEIIHTLFASDQNSFKQVVMLPFPSNESYCLGLVTREAPRFPKEAPQDDHVSVFLPTTPNPMTGFMIICPRSQLMYLDMKSEEAVKYIVSCGVIKPEKQEMR